MSVRQLIVLGVALLAAVGALFMVRGMTNRAPVETASNTVAIVGPHVLVASRDVIAGQALQPADLEWRAWVQTAMSPSFVDQTKDPKAIETYTGAVARQNLVAGEPIMAERLVKPGDQGFMAAIVTPGYRAVSLPISDETAASGFILPNDRVDVILTRKVNILSIGGGSEEEVRSGVVLQDVRVLAIDQEYERASEDNKPAAMKGAVALLELSPRDSELLAQADEMGDLSLALRPVQNADSRQKNGASSRVPTSALDQAAAASDDIRIHAFGTVRSMKTSSTGGAN